MTSEHPSWPLHEHEAVTHEHLHYHVTHNFIERVGGFEHLGYQHAHEHHHGAESHGHFPHEDLPSEHRGEAHEHPHGAPDDGSAATAVKAVKRAAKKVADSPRKVTPRKRAAPPAAD